MVVTVTCSLMVKCTPASYLPPVACLASGEVFSTNVLTTALATAIVSLVTERQNENPKCPDYSSHSENAQDMLYPDGLPEGTWDWEAIDALAEVEYLNCEGH